MEYQKIKNLLDTTLDNVLRFNTKNGQSSWSIRRNIQYKQDQTCSYSDADIVIKGVITVTNLNDINNEKKLAFKNNAPFISCIKN